MEDVRRYDHAGGMLEFDTGPFVRYDDYAAILAEFKQRAGIIAEIRAALGSDMLTLDTDLAGDVRALRAEVERLTAERDAALSRIEKARVILLFRGNGMSDVSIMDRALAALMEVPT